MQIITEGKGDNKKMFIKGPFLQAEKVNRNNRVYPERVMDMAVEKYIEEYVEKNRALGELNHPAEPQVNPERAAILTTELTKSGIYYEGKAKVLSTPMGKIVENLLSDGVTIGVSSRGLGSLKPVKGINEVQEDFVLTTAADVVFDPSAQAAFVEGVFEGAQWVMESTGVFKMIDPEEERDRLLRTKKRHLNEAKLKVFERFMRELRNS